MTESNECHLCGRNDYNSDCIHCGYETCTWHMGENGMCENCNEERLNGL